MAQQRFELFDSRIRPLTAIAAIFRMLRNKEATHEVYRITAALDGPVYERNFQLFRKTAIGERTLQNKQDLLDVLSDRAALSALPEGSVGRTYLDFITLEGLSAEGFQEEMDSSGETFEIAGEDRQRFIYRFRHTHDLLHVLTGYGRDLIGELSLLAFTQTRTKSRGIWLLIFFAYFKAKREYPGLNALACIREGKRLGEQTRGLMEADWEAFLSEPLTEIRQKLNINPPKIYLTIQNQADMLDRQYRSELTAKSA